MLGTHKVQLKGVYKTGRRWECMRSQVLLYNILQNRHVLSTPACHDDAERQQRPTDAGSPRFAARHGVDTTDGRRATRVHGEVKMSCASDARRDLDDGALTS